MPVSLKVSVRAVVEGRASCGPDVTSSRTRPGGAIVVEEYAARVAEREQARTRRGELSEVLGRLRAVVVELDGALDPEEQVRRVRAILAEVPRGADR